MSLALISNYAMWILHLFNSSSLSEQYMGKTGLNFSSVNILAYFSYYLA